jgi:hypothetical protein
MAENWQAGYDNLVKQLNAMQGQTNLYQYGPNPVSLHVNNIAASLARDYGVTNLSDIGAIGSPPRRGHGRTFVPGRGGGWQDTYYIDANNIARWNQFAKYENSSFVAGDEVPKKYLVYKFYNKNTNQEIPAYKFASEGAGEGYSDYNLQAVPDGKGGVFVVPVQQYSLSGFGELAADLGPVLAVAAVAIQIVPGIGQAIGASILGGSLTAVSAAVGLSEVAVATAVGSAALSAGTTALQGGSVEDVIKSGLAAGAASGVNFAAGGGVPGAVSGSVVGTAIQGGDVSQVVTNAFAAGVGAGVQGALPENPDAGKIIGSAARTYIATGGDLDKTLLNTAATAIGTLDQPAATAQQTQAASTPAKISESLVRFEDGGLLYEEQPDGTGKVTDQAGNERIISSREFSRIANANDTAPPVTPPAPTDATGLERITVSAPAPAPVISPTVTGTDLINQVAAQPVTTVDPKALERVIVQGQKDTANVANVAPVQTEITTPRPDTTRGLPPVTVTATTEKLPEPGFEEYKPIPEPKVSDVVTDVPPTTPPATPPPSLDRVVVTGQRDLVDPFVDIAPPPPPPEVVTPFVAPPVAPPPSLPPVEVVAKAEQLPEPGFEEYKPLPEPKISDVVTDVVAPPPPAPPPAAPIVPEVKAEEPKKEEPPKKPEKIYPTVTGVPPPARPGRQPIITGVSPARLLADALAAYRPAGAIEGEESGKERQNVWNEKSLRLKDALGL